MTDRPHMTLPNGDIIREGDYAITRDGKMVGPVVPYTNDGTNYYWTFESSPDLWRSDGTETDFREKDLIAKWRDVEPAPEPVATNYNDGEWHPWIGGDCPVHPDSVVEVRLRSGFQPRTRYSGECAWWHDNAGDDIVAFRVVTPYVDGAPDPAAPPAKRRKWWIVENRVFDSARQAKIAFPGSTPIKVKECKK